MSEKRISIEVQGECIEGLLHEASGERGAVVTHPHPLYGGDMYNNVVTAVVAAYRDAGYTTLRFNFRGIGRGEGDYDQAAGGRADVSAALHFVRGLGKTMIDLAGYSFGSWINATAVESLDAAKRLVLVSPPVDFLDFSAFTLNDKLQLVITGANDSLAPAPKLKRLLPSWNPRARLHVIEGADHFYVGKTETIRDIIREFLIF
jgi:alpha/beta superfamily hydrolase